MIGKVIQGLFLNGGPRLPNFTAQPDRIQRLPGPPTPAFATRRSLAQARGPGDSFQVDPGQLGLATTRGRKLPDSVRGKMEAALGADFSEVRIHIGPQAERIGAVAFTMGTDIYFAPGRFQPDTAPGQQLLGHELAHVVQQRQGRVRNPVGAGVTVVQDRALEAEADRLGYRAAAHRAVAQAKTAENTPSNVRISPPVSTAPGSYRLTAGAGGRQVGSIMVHAKGKTSIEITDLGVDGAHRAQGIGKMLIASAARAGQQFGKSKLTLAALDNGSGHLTQWYKGIGFTPTGANRHGFPVLEAQVGRVIAETVQRKGTGLHVRRNGAAVQGHPATAPASAAIRGIPRESSQSSATCSPRSELGHQPSFRGLGQGNRKQALGGSQVLQRMELPKPEVSPLWTLVEQNRDIGSWILSHLTARDISSLSRLRKKGMAGNIYSRKHAL